MITQETAGAIWNAYREIAAGEQLLKDMEEAALNFQHDIRRESVRDAFGKHRRLTLGIPSGDTSQRILDVAPALAKSVILAHIAAMKSQLSEANERARIELECDDIIS